MDQAHDSKPLELSENDMRQFSPFYIEKQESLVTEKFSKNGRTMDLHLVAKNVAFNIHIVASFDLNLSPPTAKLVYDFDEELGEDKEVEQLKTPPLEIITHVDKTGRRAIVETKISVLSSQHERAYFRLKLSVVDPVTRQLVVDYSQPIKVIAKRNQVRKMLERKLQSQVKAENAIVSTPVGQINLAQLAPKRERPVNDAILDTLQRLEEQQREQFRLVQQLVGQKNGSPAQNQPFKQSIRIPDPNDVDFEIAFKNFLTAYNKVTPEERPTKLRRLLMGVDKPQLDSLEEIVRCYNGQAKSAPVELVSNLDTPPNQCAHCPHKQELDMLNTLYDNFLKDPSSPEMT
jgi:hypothetical protein